MQKKIIIFIVILFITSSFWLFYQNAQQTDPNLNKNWWVVYFSNPKSNNLDFIIENHSNKNNFHWEITDGKNKLEENDVKIEKGARMEINPGNFEDKKNTVQVSSGDEKKEIYKNFEK